MAPLDGDLVEQLADEDVVHELGELGKELAEPDAEVVFRAADGAVQLGPFYGFDGLIAAWREWLSTFGSYRITVEDAFQHGDRVVVLVRQSGRTIHGGVEVPSSPSAAVFSMRDGRVASIAFYLDRTEAAAAEGFDLP
jgi:ketosteroid isomerase-like protein